MPSKVIESKVSLPAIVVLIVGSLSGAVYAVAIAYGFHPTDRQNTALVGLGSAVLVALQTIVAYLAPHTPRTDLAPTDTTGLSWRGEPISKVTVKEPQGWSYRKVTPTTSGFTPDSEEGWTYRVPSASESAPGFVPKPPSAPHVTPSAATVQQGAPTGVTDSTPDAKPTPKPPSGEGV